MTTKHEYPRPGQMIPDFCLSSTEGRAYRISSFRGRRNLLLVFCKDRVPALVAELSNRKRELEDEDTQVFVVARGDGADIENDFNFTRLIDRDGAVSRRFGAESSPAVYITDQYGEIYSAALTIQGTPLPDARDVMASLAHINAACPE